MDPAVNINFRQTTRQQRLTDTREPANINFRQTTRQQRLTDTQEPAVNMNFRQITRQQRLTNTQELAVNINFGQTTRQQRLTDTQELDVRGVRSENRQTTRQHIFYATIRLHPCKAGADTQTTHTHTHTHTHTVSLIPPWEDQREWHRMTRMTRPDCAVMCNLINTHTHTHTHKKSQTYFLEPNPHLSLVSAAEPIDGRVVLALFPFDSRRLRGSHARGDARAEGLQQLQKRASR